MEILFQEIAAPEKLTTAAIIFRILYWRDSRN